MSSPDIAIQIQEIFDNNVLRDLKDFLKRRDTLNNWNVYLLYVFHFIQSAGILVTSISVGYDVKTLIWVGICLNAGATLIHVYEKSNNMLIDKLGDDIKRIKDGNYLDQSKLVDDDENNSTASVAAIRQIDSTSLPPLPPLPPQQTVNTASI